MLLKLPKNVPPDGARSDELAAAKNIAKEMKKTAMQKKYFALKIIFVHFVDVCEDFFSKEDKRVIPLNCCAGDGEVQEESSILPRRFLGAGDVITVRVVAIII